MYSSCNVASVLVPAGHLAVSAGLPAVPGHEVRAQEAHVVQHRAEVILGVEGVLAGRLSLCKKSHFKKYIYTILKKREFPP